MRPALFVFIGLIFFGVFTHSAAANHDARSASALSGGSFDSIVLAADCTVQSVHTAHDTNEAECQSGHCGGATCHCSCHGMVGGLPVELTSEVWLSRSLGKPEAHGFAISRHLPPPIRPPRA